MRNITLLTIIPNITDATSYYRGAGPLGHLRKQMENLNLLITTSVNWSTLTLCDAVFIQRPYAKEHVTVMEMAKDQGLPIWVDYDDDLFTVTMDNPTHGMYGQEAVQKNVAKCIAMADRVTVSTPHLKARLEKLNKNITVVPNAVDFKKLNSFRPEITFPRHKLITWRGSNTHQRDLMDYAEPIIREARKPDGWTHTFIGYNPWFITQYIDNDKCKITEGLDIYEYWKFFHAIKPSVHLVPLSDTTFNRSKSNIAWIEATLAGAVTIAPEWDEWKKPGVTTYVNPKDFEEALGELKAMPNTLDLWRASMTYIEENLSLDIVNKRRSEVLLGMIS